MPSLRKLANMQKTAFSALIFIRSENVVVVVLVLGVVVIKISIP